MLRIALCFIVCMSMVAYAETPDKEVPQPRSPTAREALIRFEKGVKEADLAYKRAYAELNKKVLIDLETVKRQVMKDGNLQEANALDLKIKALQAELQNLLYPPKPPDATTTPVALKPTTQPVVRFQGKCTYRMTETGYESWFAINSGTIMVPPATPIKFQRDGNIIRAFWPNSDAMEFTLNGYDFTVKTWVKGAPPFTGRPTFTGVGRLEH